MYIFSAVRMQHQGEKSAVICKTTPDYKPYPDIVELLVGTETTSNTFPEFTTSQESHRQTMVKASTSCRAYFYTISSCSANTASDSTSLKFLIIKEDNQTLEKGHLPCPYVSRPASSQSDCQRLII
jgi:hypothetical protein